MASGGIEAALAKIDRAFGKTAVMRMGDEITEPVEAIPTGSLALDRALGIGGLPRGRIVEIYGPESSGKSTLALHVVANAQKLGIAAYIDTEHALDPNYAAVLGVDVPNMLISQPDTAEQALEIAESLIDSGEVSVLVIDSIAALVSRRELEGDYGDSNVGVMARLMSQAMRKLVARVQKTNTLLLCINQLRMKVGVVYGSPEVTTGGVALKYYSSVRLDIRRVETQRTDGEATGNRTKVKVVKNKMAPPLKEAFFDVEFGVGISREAELVDMGSAQGIIVKSGSWYKYNGSPIGQGKENARQFLIDNPAIANDIERLIKDA